MDVITKIKENGVDNLGLTFLWIGGTMKKYILISLVLHLMILFGFGIIQTTQMVKDEPKNQIVPIAFVAKQTSDNPGGKVLDTQEREKQSPEPPKTKSWKKTRRKKARGKESRKETWKERDRK